MKAFIALLIASVLLASCGSIQKCPQAYKSYHPKNKGAVHHYKPTSKRY